MIVDGSLSNPENLSVSADHSADGKLMGTFTCDAVSNAEIYRVVLTDPDGEETVLTGTESSIQGELTKTGSWTWTIQARDNQLKNDPYKAESAPIDGDPFSVISVAFDTQTENEEPEEVLYLSGTAITRPEDPTRDGYVFEGCYTDADCTDEFSFEDAKPTENLTLYAKWTAALVKLDAPTGLQMSVVRQTSGKLFATFSWDAPEADAEYKPYGYIFILTDPNG